MIIPDTFDSPGSPDNPGDSSSPGSADGISRAEVCPICGGMGYVTHDVPVGHADFGKAFPCVCQAAKRRQDRATRLRSLGNLNALTRHTFATFQIDPTRLGPDEGYLAHAFASLDEPRRQSLGERHLQQINTAAELAFHYAHGEFNATPWLLLKGGYGTGKTHLAAAIANFRVDHGDPVLFITVPDLLDHLRSAFGPSSEVAYDELFEQVRNAPMLILDDLGAESPTAWALEKLYQLLGHRHVTRLPTIITTNTEPDAFDPRIRSRLLDQSLTRICLLELPDRRSPTQTWGELDLTRLDRHDGKTFATFDLRADEGLPEREVKRLAQTVQTCAAFVENPSGWLVITGEPGCGKTHLAAAVAHECNRRGERTLFVTVSDLLNHLRATFSPGAAVRYDKRMEEIKKAPILVLDDLTIDSRNIAGWSREKLYEILLYRFDYELPTVITTNQPLQDMDLRLKSRITNEDRSVVEAITVPAYPGRNAKRRRVAAPPRPTR
jgi:DNA replication protein DnaC